MASVESQGQFDNPIYTNIWDKKVKGFRPLTKKEKESLKREPKKKEDSL